MANLKNKKIKKWFMIMSFGILGVGILIPLYYSYVNAQQPGFMYETNTEDKENVEKVTFVDNEDQSQEVGDIYMQGGGEETLVISGSNVNLSKDGDSQIFVNSDKQVTVLGGESLDVNSQNSTVMGGKSNELGAKGVVIGGEYNKIPSSEGDKTAVSIIGGTKNRVESDNVAIFGSKNSVTENIINGTNAILVGMVGLSNSDVENIFAFSNRGINPQRSNTFYIDSSFGLGLNGDSSKGGLRSYGGVSVGVIDIDSISCSTENIGIEGLSSDSQCLIGCTSKSAEYNSWDLLESSSRCQDWCESNSSRCKWTPPLPAPNPGPSYCTGNIDLSALSPCFPGWDPGDTYYDSLFKYDVVDVCPAQTSYIDNPCTYTCSEGYSWRKDIFGNDYGCYKDCTGTEYGTLHHGDVRRRYVELEAQCRSEGNACESVMYRCENGELKNRSAGQRKGIFTACTPKDSPRCDASYYNIEEGDRQPSNVAYYESCDEYNVNTQNNSCVRRTLYHFSGCMSGYTEDENGKCQADCMFNGVRYRYGETVTGYDASVKTCDSETTQCNAHILTCGQNGSFGSLLTLYPNASCSLTGASCGTGYGTGCDVHGHCETCTGYNVSNNACHSFARYYLASCETGYSVDRETNTCKKDCDLPWSGSIKHGEIATGYMRQFVNCTGSCNGTLNKYGMRCNDGNLPGSGTYRYSTCTLKPLENQTGYNRSSSVEHAVCDSFTPYRVEGDQCVASGTTYKCSACESGYTRNGKDWDSSDVACLGSCSFVSKPRDITITLSGNNGIILVYQTGFYTCPNLPVSEYRVCNNGNLSGSYLYTGYTLTGKVCNKNVAEGVKYFTHSLNSNHNVVSVSVCTEYASNGGTCNPVESYYYYKCKDEYEWPSNGADFCTKCEGSVPSHAIANNDNIPLTRGVEYHFSTGTNEACTFQCEGDYQWINGACTEPNASCTFSDGTEKPHGTSEIIYESDTAICDNKCNQKSVTCRDGVWYDENGSQVNNLYTQCTLLSGKKTQNGSTPVAGSCDKNNAGNTRTFTGISYVPNATRTSVCTEYASNGERCSDGVTYYSFMCNGTWSGSECILPCVLNGQTYTEGQSANGRKSSSKICPEVCESKTVRCVNGSWDDSVMGDCTLSSYSCNLNEYNLSTCPDNGMCQTCTGYEASGKSLCNRLSPRYKLVDCAEGYTKNGNVCIANGCTTPWNTTVENNTTVKGYLRTSGMCPSGCTYQTRTCKHGVWYAGSTPRDFGSTYKYANCDYEQKVCDSASYPYDTPPSSVGYSVCTGYNVVDGNCTEGVIKYGGQKDCTNTLWGTLTHGQSVTGYLSANAICPDDCTAGTITCNNGLLEGSTSYSNSSCTLTSSTCSLSNYPLTSCPNNAKCDECKGYNVSGDSCVSNGRYKFVSCNSGYSLSTGNGQIFCKENCIFSGHNWNGELLTKEVKHGSGVAAYAISGSLCLSELRMCNDGSLGGSYTLTECPNNCEIPSAAGGGTKLAGESLILYKLVDCPVTSCPSQSRTCQSNGQWNQPFGSDYTSKTCKSNSTQCAAEYNISESEKQEGTTYEECIQYTYVNNSCKSVKKYKPIDCAINYVLEGGECKAPCETPWGTSVKHGEDAVGYSTSSAFCPESNCKSVTRRCDNGKWMNGTVQAGFGSYKNEKCTLKAKTCSDYPLSSAGDTSKCVYDTCVPYTLNGVACSVQNPKYKIIGAQPGYYYQSGSSTCLSVCGTSSCNGPYSGSAEVGSGGFVCTNSSTHDTVQCNCPTNQVWDGSKCADKSCSKSNKNGYEVPALPSGKEKAVYKLSSSDKKWCKATASCSAGTLSITADDCKDICESDKIYLPACQNPWDSTWQASDGIGYLWSNVFTYACQYSKYIVSNCVGVCPDEDYVWNGTQCIKSSDELCVNGDPNRRCNTSNKTETEIKDGNKIVGYKRTCTNGGDDGLENRLTCHYCSDGYEWKDNTCKAITYDCYHCAQSGFPYCFPIDFSPSCDEATYRSSSYTQNGDLVQLEEKCRVDTSKAGCSQAYTDADMAGFSNEQSCGTQKTKWVCKIGNGYLACASTDQGAQHSCSVWK